MNQMMDELLALIEAKKDPEEILRDLMVKYNVLDYEELLEILEPYIYECREELEVDLEA